MPLLTPDYPYNPPGFLKNGLLMTLYTALWISREWEQHIAEPEPPYQQHIFTGAQGVPIFGIMAVPPNPRGTIIGTYGITGSVENQWFLKILGRKAFAMGYAVVLFDWRAHGKTALLSPTLTSDGLYEGEDFVLIAAQAKAMGCPSKFWFTGYSLGGQLALWGVKAGQHLSPEAKAMGITTKEIGGGAVICPSLDSNPSLVYLENSTFGKYLDKAIAKDLHKLAMDIYNAHPGALDLGAIERANSIRGFDHELVISRLGFSSVEAYYDATSPRHILPDLQKPTLILYAEDDPMFYPGIVPDLKAICRGNRAVDLISTRYGGHAGYISSKECQRQTGDKDHWWAWNRVLAWFNQQVGATTESRQIAGIRG